MDLGCGGALRVKGNCWREIMCQTENFPCIRVKKKKENESLRVSPEMKGFTSVDELPLSCFLLFNAS